MSTKHLADLSNALSHKDDMARALQHDFSCENQMLLSQAIDRSIQAAYKVDLADIDIKYPFL